MYACSIIASCIVVLGHLFLMNFIESLHENYKLYRLILLYFISDLFPSEVSIELNIVVYLLKKLRIFLKCLFRMQIDVINRN